jgi:hypothetical protein
MNNYWYTDTPAQQGGKFTFRYALTSSRDMSEGESAAFAAEQRSPLVAIRRYNMGWVPLLPETGNGFLDATPSGVKVLTMRTDLGSRDSYLLRVQNMTPGPVHAELHFSNRGLQEAFLSSMLGQRVGKVDWNQQEISLAMRPYEIKTVVLKMRANSAE